MQTRNILHFLLPLSAAFMLSACDGANDGASDRQSTSGSDSDADKIAQSEATTEAMPEAMPDAMPEAMPDAMVAAMTEEAAEFAAANAENVQRAAAELIYIDASSFDTFSASIEAMRTALPAADQDKLSAALAALAAPSIAPAAGDDMPTTPTLSAEEMAFKTFGEKLDGFNFDDLMVFADVEE